MNKATEFFALHLAVLMLGNPFYTRLWKADNHLLHNSLTSAMPWLTPVRAILLHIPARGLHVGRNPPQPALYPDPPLPCHPPSYWLRLFSSQTFSRINTPTFLKPSHSAPTCL